MVNTGQAVVKNFTNRSNYWQFDVASKEKVKVEMPVFDFPDWQVFANGKKISHDKDNLLKRIQFDLDPGSYKVMGKFKNTPIRIFSNFFSLISLMILIYLIYGKKFKKF